MQRIQITFSKSGALIYIGHLDLNTIWERAARRAGLALVYTHGFHPQPKIRLASALPLGYSSRCEVADILLNENTNLTELPARLQAVMPAGIILLSVESVEEKAPPLQKQLIAAEYEVGMKDLTAIVELERKIDNLLAASTIRRERRGKEYDLRPLIEGLEICPTPPDGDLQVVRKSITISDGRETGSGNCLWMRLAAREGATGRPEEVLEALGLSPDEAKIERTRLIFQK